MNWQSLKQSCPDREFLEREIRRNWHLVSVLAALPLLAIIIALVRPSQVDSAIAVEEPNVQEIRARREPPIPATPFKGGETRESRARDAISESRRLIQERPYDVDVPLEMMRMGNLYFSALRDYDAAIQQYELLMIHHPDFEGLEDVYTNLATCYRYSGQMGLERETYRRMMKEFPEGSDLYRIGKEALEPEWKSSIDEEAVYV